MKKKQIWYIFLLAALCSIPAAAQSNTLWMVQEPSNTTNSGAIAYSPDGRLVASGRGDSDDVHIRNAKTGELIRTLSGRDNNPNVIAFSPNGLYLATGTGGGGSTLNLNLWRVSDGLRLVGRIGAFTNGTNGASFSPDSQLLVVSGFHNTSYKIYHVPDMTLVSTIANFDPDLGYSVRINDVQYSPDGQIIALADTRSIKLRNAADGSLIRTINTNSPNTMPTTSIKFTPDGRFVAGGVTKLDPTYSTCIECRIKMFSVPDGALVHTFSVGAGIPDAKIGFSSDGKVIGAGFPDEGSTYGGSNAFWQVNNEKLLRRDQRAFWVQSFAYAPSANLFAFYGADGVVSVMRAPLALSDD